MTELDNYDYIGTACLGDVKYEDGYDKWKDIKEVFKNKKSVNIVPLHNSKDIIGKIKFFCLNDKTKELKIGINKENLTVGLDAVNGVSPRWVFDNKGKIVDVLHFAIGNSFDPLCDKSVCYVAKNRSKDEKMTKDLEEKIKELEEKNQVLEEKKLEIQNKYNELEINLLEKKYKAFEDYLSKSKDKEKTEESEEKEEKELDLTKNKDIEQNIETKPAGAGYSKRKSFLGNTTSNTKELEANRKYK